jgi:hypothetical protein
MGSYKVIFNESANRELASIDRQFIARILTAGEALTADPFLPVPSSPAVSARVLPFSDSAPSNTHHSA